MSKEELIAGVWGGRSLSEHTVAVVISDLRKALDDDVKNPRYIETVAKRGYRLIANDAAPKAPAAAEPPRRRLATGKGWLFVLAGLAAAAAALAALSLPARSSSEATIITVNNIQNETGEARFDPIAAAANEFSADFIREADRSLLIRDFFNEPSWDPKRFTSRRFGRNARVFHLYGKLVIDGASPYLALSLADGRDWSTIWTATLPVGEDGVAAPLRVSVGEMLATVERIERMEKAETETGDSG